ncbi:hypothetical protein E2C01_087094 [Portunus trituberculatus]|uniref:Uncharacterized protein n=1 Tax=Portunus trituberculatus TaxID=210409 RepID=A0A5B7JI50_PORTR|nr:hypothetical protein [Portunus trituberculatus]
MHCRGSDNERVGAGVAVRGVWVESGACVEEEEEEKDVRKWMRGRLDKWRTVSKEDNTCDCKDE